MGASRLSLFLIAGAACASLSARAATDEAGVPKPKATASATVTVTAETSPVEVTKTPNQVTVITAEEIRQSGARDLAELLQRALPGQLVQSGGAGTIADPLLGGSRPQDTLVLLDGVRVTDATGIGANLSSISLAGIARVEVQRGPSSALYGSDAQGGVIALYTDAAVAKGAHGDWSLGLGTNGLSRLEGLDSFGWEGGGARLALSGARQDAPTDADHAFREGGAFLGVNQALGENHTLSLVYRAAFIGVPLPYKSAALGAPFDYEPARQDTVRNQQALATLRSGWGADWATEATVAYSEQTRLEPNDYAMFGGPPVYAFTSYGSQANVAVHWNPSPKWNASFLLQGVQERAVQPDYAGGLTRGEGRHLAAALELAWEPVDALRLVGSLRQQRDRQVFLESTGVPETKDDQTTGKLGVNWRLPGGFRVYASGGSSFSNPLLYQVLYNAGTPGSPLLSNEESHFLQAGLGWERGPWRARLEAWRTTMGAVVNFDYTTFTYAMGRDLRFQGLEGALDYHADHWSLGGWARSQEARDLTLPRAQQLQGTAVVRRPFFAFGLKADAKVSAFRAGLVWSWQGPRYDYFGSGYGPGRVHYNDLSASLAWDFREDMSLTLRGANLLQPKLTVAEWQAGSTNFQNDAYTIFNYPAPPPTVSLEFRIRY